MAWKYDRSSKIAHEPFNRTRLRAFCELDTTIYCCDIRKIYAIRNVTIRIVFYRDWFFRSDLWYFESILLYAKSKKSKLYFTLKRYFKQLQFLNELYVALHRTKFCPLNSWINLYKRRICFLRHLLYLLRNLNTKITSYEASKHFQWICVQFTMQLRQYNCCSRHFLNKIYEQASRHDFSHFKLAERSIIKQKNLQSYRTKENI